MSQRAATKRDVLDTLSWMDALLEAGWITGGFNQYGGRKRRPYPEFHCLVGAMRAAVREVAEATGPGSLWSLIQATELTLVETFVEEILGHEFTPRRLSPIDSFMLIGWNDTQNDAGPVRELVQKSAARIGSK